MEKFRGRNFNLVLYEEDATHKKAIDLIKKNYDYAIICHDRDTNEAGEVKKEHYHIVVRFNNPKWNTAFAEELGITPNYIEECRDLKRSLLYLIHYYDTDKYQYSLADVKGTLKNKLEGYLNCEGKSESEKVLEIFNEIDSIEEFIDYRIFIKHIAKIGYWDVLRRSSSLILRYIDCHNSEFRL